MKNLGILSVYKTCWLCITDPLLTKVWFVVKHVMNPVACVKISAMYLFACARMVQWSAQKCHKGLSAFQISSKDESRVHEAQTFTLKSDVTAVWFRGAPAFGLKTCEQFPATQHKHAQYWGTVHLDKTDTSGWRRDLIGRHEEQGWGEQVQAKR